MRISQGMIAAITTGILYATAVRADHQPVIAMPGNPSTPVVIDGQDASWAVIEGDWGLYRPGHVAPTVLYPYAPDVDHWHTRSYYPFTGKRPRSGRLEIIPPANRRLPARAESFHRYWSNDGPAVPVQTEYPAVLPPVILAPRVRSLN
jgi:hypothetical protein